MIKLYVALICFLSNIPGAYAKEDPLNFLVYDSDLVPHYLCNTSGDYWSLIDILIKKM